VTLVKQASKDSNRRKRHFQQRENQINNFLNYVKKRKNEKKNNQSTKNEKGNKLH